MRISILFLPCKSSRFEFRLVGMVGVAVLAVAAAVTAPGCVPGLFPDPNKHAFRAYPAVALDGRERVMTYDLMALGDLARDDLLELNVSGDGVEAVFLLIEDSTDNEAGLLAGGGHPERPFRYRVQEANRYYVYALFDQQRPAAERVARIRAAVVDGNDQPLAEQPVRVVFQEGWLTGPGLVDPESFTDEQTQFLVYIRDQVRTGVLDRLRVIFADTPVRIVAQDEPEPAGPFSTLTLVGDRQLAGDETLEVAVPPLVGDLPECLQAVIFGEVLPRGAFVDPGNQVPDDNAVVYVGSFQGRGEACQTGATDSVSTIVLGLAQTAAHEIGHLIGFYHVPLTDVMDRSPTLAFQRELTFARGQLLVESDAETFVLTRIVQDPAIYFRLAFDQD